MVKPQASTKGTKHKKVAAPAAKSATGNPSWTEIDTTGMTPEQIAALAEQSIAQRARKPRNKVPAETRKVPEKPARDAKIVKSSKKAPKKPVVAIKRPVGRPSMFTKELADEIIERLSDGESLRSICSEERMPKKATVFRWVAANKEFCDLYTRSREIQAETMAEDILQIADDGLNDTYEDGDGNKRTDHDVIARSRLRVDARKWLAAKLMPRKYSDKVDVNHGVQPDNPLASLLSQINGTALPVVKGGEDS